MKNCGDEAQDAGRDGVPGAYAFFARYILRPWHSCLDVGGGMGTGLQILKHRTKNVKSIDLDARLEKHGVTQGCIEDEPDKGYSWVIAIDSIEHNIDDVGFLSHCWRACRLGIFITTPNLAHHPDRKWPYHVREYTPQTLIALFDQVAPGTSRLQLGGEVYGGNISLRHLSQAWEHQAVLCFKRGGGLARMMIRAREPWIMTRDCIRSHNKA